MLSASTPTPSSALQSIDHASDPVSDAEPQLPRQDDAETGLFRTATPLHRKASQDTTQTSASEVVRATSFPDTDFEKRYPPDNIGDEAADQARVWKVYRDQATEQDDRLLDTWHKTLDILLIFSTLFSAILTAFLIESYKMLKQDYSQFMANALFRIAMDNRAARGFSVLDIPTENDMQPPDSFTAPVQAKWINYLWFTCLFVTLSTALLCILVKQWLDGYKRTVATTALTPRAWTHRHVLCYNGLKTWKIGGIISLLPAALHAALFLFFAGVCVFLRPLDHAFGFTLVGVTATMFLLYVTANLLPTFFEQCAYRTLLATQLKRGARLLRRLGSLELRRGAPPSTLAESGPLHPPNEASRLADLDAQALSWLITSAGHNVSVIAIQAISGATEESQLAMALRRVRSAIAPSLNAYLEYRARDFTEEALAQFPRLAAEYAACLRAYRVLGTSSGGLFPPGGLPEGIIPPEGLPGSRRKFRERVNWIVITASNPQAGLKSAPSELLSGLLDSLDTEKHHTQLCTRHTAVYLIDVLLQDPTLPSADEGTKWTVLSLLFNLTHIARPVSDEPSGLSTERFLTWLDLAGLGDYFPPSLRENMRSSLLDLEIWSAFALRPNLLTPRVGKITAKEVAMRAAHLVTRERAADRNLTHKQYPVCFSDFLASELFLGSRWTRRELDAMSQVFDIVGQRPPLCYLAIARLLLACSASMTRDGWRAEQQFGLFLRRRDHSERYPSVLELEHAGSALCFLDVLEAGGVTPWQALHDLIQSGTACVPGIYVARLAASIASQLTAHNSGDGFTKLRIQHFFAVPLLAPILSAILGSWPERTHATWLDWELDQLCLLGVVKFLHNCARLSPGATESAYTQLQISSSVLGRIATLVHQRLLVDTDKYEHLRARQKLADELQAALTLARSSSEPPKRLTLPGSVAIELAAQSALIRGASDAIVGHNSHRRPLDQYLEALRRRIASYHDREKSSSIPASKRAQFPDDLAPPYVIRYGLELLQSTLEKELETSVQHGESTTSAFLDYLSQVSKERNASSRQAPVTLMILSQPPAALPSRSQPSSSLLPPASPHTPSSAVSRSTDGYSSPGMVSMFQSYSATMDSHTTIDSEMETPPPHEDNNDCGAGSPNVGTAGSSGEN